MASCRASMRRSNPASPKTERMPSIKLTVRSPCDRRQDRSSRKVDRVPNGRGHGASTAVPANPRRYRDTTTIAASTMLSIYTMAATSGHWGSGAPERTVLGPDALPCWMALRHQAAPASPSIDQALVKRPERCLSFTRGRRDDRHLGNVGLFDRGVVRYRGGAARGRRCNR
jgi:hypothetical protein